MESRSSCSKHARGAWLAFAWQFPLALLFALVLGGGCKSGDSSDSHPVQKPAGDGVPAAPDSHAPPPSTDETAKEHQNDSQAPDTAPPSVPSAPFDASSCDPAEPRADCKDGWCTVPAGCFVMGSPESEPGHARIQEQRTIVTLTHAFAIQRTEVTRAQWMELDLPDPNVQLDDGTGDCTDDARCPIGNVTWFEAAAFANQLSARSDPPLPPCYDLIDCTGELGKGMTCKSAKQTAPTLYACEGFRLPTDAEWEYAARAGTTSAFYSGEMTARGELNVCTADDKLAEIAWYCDNSAGKTHPVGKLKPNAFGLFDMSGNVLEWINNWDSGRAPEAPTDPGGQLHTEPDEIRIGRILRGGNYRQWPVLCRSAWHYTGSWQLTAPGIGLRLVRTLP